MSSLTPQQALEQARAQARAAQAAADQAQAAADQVALAASAATGGAVDPTVFRLAIFVLAIFVGYFVVGALLAVGVRYTPGLEGPGWARLMGFLALILASINIFGGFLVTQRMLAMYRRKD